MVKPMKAPTPPTLPGKLISKHGLKKAWARFKRTAAWKAYVRRRLAHEKKRLMS